MKFFAFFCFMVLAMTCFLEAAIVSNGDPAIIVAAFLFFAAAVYAAEYKEVI